MKHTTRQHTLTALVCALACACALWLIAATHAQAQDEGAQMEQNFKKLSADEEARLRAVLAEPTKKEALTNNLRTQLDAKREAALKLGDVNVLLAVYREAAALLPDAQYRNNLGGELLNRGEIAEGNKWRLEAFNVAETDYRRAFYLANIANDMYRQNKDAESWSRIEQAESLLKSLRPRQDWQHRDVARTHSTLYQTKSYLYGRKGQDLAAIEAINAAVIYARQAVKWVANSTRELDKFYTYDDLAGRLNRKTYTLMEAKKLGMAEVAMQEYLRLFQEVEMPANAQAFAFANAARLRFNQREFVQEEKLERQALAKLQQLNYAPTDPRMLERYQWIALALFGQKRYKESVAVFEYLDQLAGDDEKLKARVRFGSARSRSYLFNNMPVQAAPLLALAASNSAKFYGLHPSGAQHFFTAQASGLHGVALWRIGSAESKAQAYSLLKTAVRDYMAPENVDYLENIGIRKESRELIFETYLDAAAQTNPADALSALGVADWLRGGLVQEALGDAAVRAAASNDVLSNLVRLDQDAKNEIKGLRNFLGGEAGSAAASPLPDVAVKMRERIALLEKSRAEVQVQIKAKFPDYERLVRPLPPSTLAIQSQLKTNEALIVLQPTDDAVYVWALTRSGGSTGGTFHRAALTSTDLGKLVKRLRTSLDVAGLPANRMPAFDHQAAQALYAKLLMPVQRGLQGKTSLIVAAGGALGQIPFGVLQTTTNPLTSSGQTEAASWLIQQAAITHVPSVAAWLSMRALPHKTAEQPMLAWGDPLFNLGNAVLVPNTQPVRDMSTPVRTESVEVAVRKVNLTRANTAVDLEKEDPRSALKYADIPALPETRDELLAIAKTLGADTAKDIILGSQATRDSVLRENKNGNLAKRRVVAFATHGLMAGDLPNLTQPALAMAGTKDDATNVLAPLLTLEDVLTLKLNADWVVLSACNTAAADGKAEEALSGLARGFFYAGSRSLLVTHWAVDSDSAVTLTTETFKHYQNNPMAQKAESLRQAMLKVMSEPKTAHPAYWAPYALVGDGAR